VRFIRVAPQQENRTTTSAADATWVDLDQVTAITGHLGSDSAGLAVTSDCRPAEHYPSIQLATSDGQTHRVPLGRYADQASAFLAIQRFTSALARNDMDSFEIGLVALRD